MQDCIITRRNGSGQGKTPKIENIVGSIQKTTLSPLHFSQNGNELLNFQNLTEDTSVSIFHDFEKQDFDKIRVLNNSAIDEQIDDFNDLISPHFQRRQKYIGLLPNYNYYLWANKDNININFLDLRKCIVAEADEIYAGFYKENNEKALAIFGIDSSTEWLRMWLISTISENAVRNHYSYNGYNRDADVLYSFTYKNINYYISSCDGQRQDSKFFNYKIGQIDNVYIYDGEEQTNYYIPDFLFELLDNTNIVALLS